MEPESALAYPPDADGMVLVRTGRAERLRRAELHRRHPRPAPGKGARDLRVRRRRVRREGRPDGPAPRGPAGVAFGKAGEMHAGQGREHARPREAPCHDHRPPAGLRRGRKCSRRAPPGSSPDTGAYASLGGPVLHRAVTHAGGPYRYGDIEVEGLAVYTNNPPAGAFRGFGVPQVNFALESALDQLAAEAGISPWEIRFRNAVRPGDRLPNGQARRARHRPRGMPAGAERAIRGSAGQVGHCLRLQEHGPRHGTPRHRPLRREDRRRTTWSFSPARRA